MDIHRNVYMWGQQEQINKMKLEGASLVMTRSMSGKTFFRHCLEVMLCKKIIIIFVLQYILLKSPLLVRCLKLVPDRAQAFWALEVIFEWYPSIKI